MSKIDGVEWGIIARNTLNMSTLSNVTSRGDEDNSPSVGLTPEAFPVAENVENGVSVEYAPDPEKSWYVMRASYGREDKAFDYMVADGTYCYIAKRWVDRIVMGKRRRMLEALIPNLIFVYTTQQKAEEYTKTTGYLTYYYNHFKLNDEQKNPPLTVPQREMENFIRTTCSHNEHILFVDPAKCHYRSGDLVRVREGVFQGVEGKVARVAGQQRVVISLSEIGLISTAYIPTAFIEKI